MATTAAPSASPGTHHGWSSIVRSLLCVQRSPCELRRLCEPREPLRPSAERALALDADGILICANCAGSHRGLGTHISKVRSTDLDTFTDDEFEWIESLGNAKSNGLWEAGLPSSMRRPAADAPACIRRIWLKQKYDEQRFTAGTQSSVPPDHESHRGWMWKQGGVVPTWRKRYFCLDHGRLLWFTSEAVGDSSFRGSMPLLGTSLHLDDADGRTLTLRAPAEDGRTVSLLLRTVDSEAAEEWLWSLYQSAAAAECMSPSAAAPPQRRKGFLSFR